VLASAKPSSALINFCLIFTPLGIIKLAAPVFAGLPPFLQISQ
jgi:hypothetical protein